MGNYVSFIHTNIVLYSSHEVYYEEKNTKLYSSPYKYCRRVRLTRARKFRTSWLYYAFNALNANSTPYFQHILKMEGFWKLPSLIFLFFFLRKLRNIPIEVLSYNEVVKTAESRMSWLYLHLMLEVDGKTAAKGFAARPFVSEKLIILFTSQCINSFSTNIISFNIKFLLFIFINFWLFLFIIPLHILTILRMKIVIKIFKTEEIAAPRTVISRLISRK